MATTTRIDALKIALADALAARPALSGVQVGSAFLGDQSLRESIQLAGPDDITQEYAALGRSPLAVDETLSLGGFVFVIRPGAGEDTIRAVRARAVALASEVEGTIRADPSLGAVVKWARFRASGMREGAHPDGRACLFDFTIEAFSRLSP